MRLALLALVFAGCAPVAAPVERPTCDATTRGLIFKNDDGSRYLCEKYTSGAYGYRVVQRGGL